MAVERALVVLVLMVTCACRCGSATCWTNARKPLPAPLVCSGPFRVSSTPTTRDSGSADGLILDREQCRPENMTELSQVAKTSIGVVSVVVAPVGFGLAFVNVKRIRIGDGVLFQWIMTVSMWLVGMVANFAMGQPELYYLSAAGGVLLSAGLMAALVAIKLVGMAVMLVVAGGVTLIASWLMNEFILCKAYNYNPGNIISIVLVVLSTVLVILVRSTGEIEVTKDKKERSDSKDATMDVEDAEDDVDNDDEVENDDDRTLLISSTRHNNYSSVGNAFHGNRPSRPGRTTSNYDTHSRHSEVKPHSINRSPRMAIYDGVGGTEFAEANRLKNETLEQKLLKFFSGRQHFALGYTISLFVGLLFGLQFLPIEFLKSCDDSYFSCYSVFYIFGHLSGALLTSSLILVVYCAVKRCQIEMSGRLVAHALCAGVMWGLGLVALLSAEDLLGFERSLPVTLATTCIISSPIGVFFFKEIKGWYIPFYILLFPLRVAGMVLFAVCY